MTRRDVYDAYLKSQEWHNVKVKVFKIKGKKCQRCYSKESLHVHHATYDRFQREDIGKDLYVLCESCHELYHKQINGVTSIKKTVAFIKRRLKHGKHFITVKKEIPEPVENPDVKYIKFSKLYNIPIEEAKVLYDKLMKSSL